MKRKKKGLLKISEIAKIADLPVSTIRYYTNIGILKVTEFSRGGYRLFDRKEALENIKKIRNAVGYRTPLKEVWKIIKCDERENV